MKEMGEFLGDGFVFRSMVEEGSEVGVQGVFELHGVQDVFDLHGPMVISCRLNFLLDLVGGFAGGCFFLVGWRGGLWFLFIGALGGS